MLPGSVSDLPREKQTDELVAGACVDRGPAPVAAESVEAVTAEAANDIRLKKAAAASLQLMGED
jgi:hypothetical protein